ncbi:MAG: RNA pseudouridine synthase [Chitinophagales bacterium]
MNALEVLYEDNHLLIVNKPAGVLSQVDKSGDTSIEQLAKQYIKEKYQKPGEAFIGVAHRIDRPVSGVLILARTSKALTRLNEMFRTREVQKTYWAVVEARPELPENTLVHWLRKNEKKNMTHAFMMERSDAQRSELSYRYIGSSDKYHLLEVDPLTGRHHQIRVQLSSIGCSIKGDLKYGAKRSNSNGAIHLHARKIVFQHPVRKEPLEVTAPVPDDVVWKFFEQQFASGNNVNH